MKVLIMDMRHNKTRIKGLRNLLKACQMGESQIIENLRIRHTKIGKVTVYIIEDISLYHGIANYEYKEGV